MVIKDFDEIYKDVLAETKAEFPGFEIIQKKDSLLMKVIDVALKVITFGQMNTFMTGFITTLGEKVYVNEGWDKSSPASNAAVIRHERVHMRQSKKYGRFLFSFLYLVFPFPVGIAYFRKKFEQEAYEESMRAYYEYRGSSFFTPRVKEYFLSHFTTAQYFWMWPWRSNLSKWYDAALVKVKSGK